MRYHHLVLTLSMVAGSLLPVTAAFAGIQVGGQEAPATTSQPLQPKAAPAAPAADQAGGGIRQAAPPPAAEKPKYQPGDLLKMADEFRARYRKDNATLRGMELPKSKYRYGFVVAFFDTKSLLNPTLVGQLSKLEKMDGIQFKLMKSQNNVNKKITDFSKEEIEKLSKVEMPLARDDTNGQIAANYKVTKFPTVLYETPSGEVVKFFVPNTMESVFQRIRKEAVIVDQKK